jgi:hypothetical protein
MVRNTGMRIYDYQPKACRVPFSGLFICTDQEGNKLLRKLEPPKHDIWDPKRTEDQSGKKALDEIKLWIREEVKKLNPLFAGSSFNESELAKYVPDITPEDPKDVPKDESGNDEEESLEPKPADEQPPVKPVPAKPVDVNPGDKTDGGGGPTKKEGGGGGGGNGGGGEGGGNTGPSGAGTADDTKPPAIQARVHPPPCPFSDCTYPCFRRPAMICLTTTGLVMSILARTSEVTGPFCSAKCRRMWRTLDNRLSRIM